MKSVCWKAGRLRKSSAIAADASSAVKRPIVAVIDVANQAYGRREEGFGIHQALAGAAGGMPMRVWQATR